jgi:hypothetical protein
MALRIWIRHGQAPRQVSGVEIAEANGRLRPKPASPIAPKLPGRALSLFSFRFYEKVARDNTHSANC